MYRHRHELTLQRLHKKYGTAVRIGPNAVSISDPEAIDSIYAFKDELQKVIHCHLPVIEMYYLTVRMT